MESNQSCTGGCFEKVSEVIWFVNVGNESGRDRQVMYIAFVGGWSEGEESARMRCGEGSGVLDRERVGLSLFTGELGGSSDTAD